MSAIPSAGFYETPGRRFVFNDHVCMEMLHGVPIEKRTGRLVQVRKGRGEFGSDIFIVRLRDGSLMSYENVLIRPVPDPRFEEAFYVSNGTPAPLIPDQPPYPDDSQEEEYSIKGKWPETGFIIEEPRQPESARQSFAMVISTNAGREALPPEGSPPENG